MKTYALTTGLVTALLTMSLIPTNSLAQDTRPSNGRHLSTGHWKSGIIGQSVLSYGGFCVQFGHPPTPCPDSVPYATTVLVHSQEGKFVTAVATDEGGYFQLFLKPGTYSLTAYTPGPADPKLGTVVSMATTVTVENKEFATAFVFSAYLFP